MQELERTNVDQTNNQKDESIIEEVANDNYYAKHNFEDNQNFNQNELQFGANQSRHENSFNKLQSIQDPVSVTSI